jgi:hypothetical protein
VWVRDSLFGLRWCVRRPLFFSERVDVESSDTCEALVGSAGGAAGWTDECDCGS